MPTIRRQLRTKVPADVKSLARSHTRMAINTLAGIARSRGAPESARAYCAVALLDRGWGRANVTHTDADGGPIQVIIRQVVDITGQSDSEPVLIEHDQG